MNNEYEVLDEALNYLNESKIIDGIDITGLTHIDKNIEVESSYKKIDSKIIKYVNQIFNENIDDIIKDYNRRYNDKISKNNMKITWINFYRNGVEFNIEADKYNGWYNCTIDIRKYEQFLSNNTGNNGFYYSFND